MGLGQADGRGSGGMRGAYSDPPRGQSLYARRHHLLVELKSQLDKLICPSSLGPHPSPATVIAIITMTMDATQVNTRSRKEVDRISKFSRMCGQIATMSQDVSFQLLKPPSQAVSYYSLHKSPRQFRSFCS